MHDLLKMAESLDDLSDEFVSKFMPPKPTLLYMYDVIARSQTLVQPKRWWITIPSGYWRVLWGYFLLGISSADVFRCGMSLAFCQAPYVAFDLYVLQFVFAIDILLKFTSAYPKGGGLLELRANKIAMHYIQTTFIVDLFALLPLELWLTPCWPDDPTGTHWLSFLALRPSDDFRSSAAAGCFARPYVNFLQFFSWQWLHFLRWIGNWVRCDSWRSVTSTQNDGVLQVVKFFVLIVMVGHLACCLNFWASITGDGALTPICSYRSLRSLAWDPYVAATLEKHNQLDPFNMILANTTGPKLAAGSPRDLVTPRDALEASYYSTQGFWELWIFWFYASFAMMLGDAFGAKVTTSRVNAVFLMLVGNVLFAVVFGTVVLGMQRMTASRDEFAERMANINETMRWKGVPEKFQRRVRRFYEFLWLVDGAAANEDRGQGASPMQWLDELPTGLRVEINTARYSPVLRNCILFEDVDWEAIVMISQQLTPMLYMPGEVIVKEGLVGYSMYFIERGQVKIITGYGTDKEKQIGTLSAGSFFGEVALTQQAGVQRAATCMSATVLMLDKLTRSSLEHVASSFPQLLATIRRVAIARRRDLGEEIRAVSKTASSSILVQKFANKLKLARENSQKRKLGDVLRAGAGAGAGPGGLAREPMRAARAGAGLGSVAGLSKPGLARQRTLGNKTIVASLLKAKGEERSPPSSRGRQYMPFSSPRGSSVGERNGKVAPLPCGDADNSIRPTWSAAHKGRPAQAVRSDTLSETQMACRTALMHQSTMHQLPAPHPTVAEPTAVPGGGTGGAVEGAGGHHDSAMRATMEQMLEVQQNLMMHVARLEEKLRPRRNRGDHHTNRSSAQEHGRRVEFA